VRSPLGHIAEGSALVLEASILVGDAVARLRELPDGVARTCVTSPPYWGLRDYGNDGQLGLEGTPQEFVENLCLVFDEVWRVLADDGTLWVNLGDSYAGSGKGGQSAAKRSENWQPEYANKGLVPEGLKAKDLVGIPWRFAFAMQDCGWYLRQDIIWAKPNPMPESVTDRCTKSHEYIFLFSKRPKYYYDHEAIKSPVKDDWGTRDRTNGKYHNEGTGLQPHSGLEKKYDMANKRSVWTVSTKPYKGAHFAVYPPALIEPCIKAGSAEGDTVLDPFSGSGTTGEVALKNGRNYVGIELNPDYAALSEKRINNAIGMLGEVRVESC
jgi:DNA modification methylase